MISRFCAVAALALLFTVLVPDSKVQAQVCESCQVAPPSNAHIGAWLSNALNGNRGSGCNKWKGPPPRYVAPEYYDYLNKRYPKFTGGFHSSYFHNMGLPPGDIGPRGNGIYPTPW